jgi:hypothetical protein
LTTADRPLVGSGSVETPNPTFTIQVGQRASSFEMRAGSTIDFVSTTTNGTSTGCVDATGGSRTRPR